MADTFTSGIHIYTHICRDQNLGIWGAKSITGEGIQNRNHICINRGGDTWDKGSIVNTAMKNRIDTRIDPNGERKATDTFLLVSRNHNRICMPICWHILDLGTFYQDNDNHSCKHIINYQDIWGRAGITFLILIFILPGSPLGRNKLPTTCI